jgi:hypothetical protein
VNIPTDRGLMPKNCTCKEADLDKLDKVKKLVQESKGSIFSGENLDKINDLMEIAISSNSQFKIGHLIAGIAEYTVDSILHNGNSEVTIMRTNVFIRENHNKKIKSYLNGSTYEKFEKQLVESQRDWLEPVDRKKLKTTTGVNQRGIAFLDKDTFLTLGNIIELSNHKKHKKKIKEQLEKFLLQMSLKNESKTKKNEPDSDFNKATEFLKSLKTKENEKGFIHDYSALLSIETELKIINRMPVYDANVAVHLVKLRSLDTKIMTVENIVNDILPGKKEYGQYLERIPETDLFKVVFPQKDKLQLNTALNVNFTKLEAFKKNYLETKYALRRPLVYQN